MKTDLVKRSVIEPVIVDEAEKQLGLHEGLSVLKGLIYETLTLDNEEDDISITQKMGISLTKAVQRDGVNIINIQSAIINKITVNLVEALKVIDSINNGGKVNPIKECMRYLADKQLTFKPAIEMMKKEYVKEILDRSETQEKAAEKLQIHTVTVNRIINDKKGVKNEENI